MMADAATALSDFREIVSIEVSGKPPLIVGGHAVNAWALYYLPRIGTELLKFEPFTSKDLDLLGTRTLLDALHARFGGTLEVAPPRTPVIGRVVTEIRGRTFKIEVLHSVRGLPKSADVEAVVLDVERFRIRVPRPPQLLEAKLDNVAHLDQSERQDVRHGQILTLCTREFLHDVLSSAESGAISDRAAVNALEEVRNIVTSATARKIGKPIELSGCWPLGALRGSSSPRVARFVANRLSRLF